jgi:hypothetical protein
MRGLRHTIGYIAYDGGDVMSNEEQKKLIDRVTRKHRAGELAVDFRIAAADGIPFGEESGTPRLTQRDQPRCADMGPSDVRPRLRRFPWPCHANRFALSFIRQPVISHGEAGL